MKYDDNGILVRCEIGTVDEMVAAFRDFLERSQFQQENGFSEMVDGLESAANDREATEKRRRPKLKIT